MSDQIKNRVVGAIVLFALAVVFIPKIFDGEKETQRREFVAIPKKPIHQPPRKNIESSDELTLSENDVVQASSAADITDSTVETSNDLTVKTIKAPINTNKTEALQPTVEIPVITKSTAAKSQAWVIRMGTFGNPNNVNALVKNLRKKGFTAFSVPRVPQAGISNKVFVGPELTQSALVKFQPQLKREFKESGVIEKYNPLQ